MRIVKLLIVKDEEHDNLISVIPSSYFICRMYDNKSVKFQIEISTDEDSNPIIEFEKVYLRFISGNVDVGKVLVTKVDNIYEFELSSEYTQNSLLNLQVIFEESSGVKIRTNIIKFKLSNSLPLDSEYYQNLSYFNRLVHDKLVVLSYDSNSKELFVFDDLGNKLCSFDIGYMTGGDES